MGNKLAVPCLLFLVFTLNSMHQHHVRTSMSLASQQFLLASLADAFIKNNYTVVRELLENNCSKLNINLPLRCKKFNGRVIFNIIHNEYVRRHSQYYATYKEKECYAEYMQLYNFFCEHFKDQIDVNIKDIVPVGYYELMLLPEFGSTPLMYIIDRLLKCTESIKSIKNIFIEFLSRFGPQVDLTIKNKDDKTALEMCTIVPEDNDILREKKEFIYDMLLIMTRRKFTTPCLKNLHNCHFRFV